MRPKRTPSPSHSRHASTDSTTHRRLGSRSLSPAVANSSSRAPASFVPNDRSLPSRDVSADTLTDAYVSFILYCNPNFSLDVDTSTLRNTFNTPPKSDNKDFETFPLFQLIKKFDAKEIKTWAQLALDLGVEAPDTSKGQSVQKVQQYSVRLKRWMRAMHVDAFFEYLLNKPHAYYQDLPPPNDPYPSGGRDGVTADEDLAIRALDPSFRPKRGRRRNSEAEQDDEAQGGAENFASANPPSAYPASAYPTANLSFNASSSTDAWVNAASAIQPQDFGPWASKLDGPHSAIAATAPAHVRWQNPSTPHPMTALPGSMQAHIDAALEPKSAITPSSSSRKRRKHGPAVSSAWPSATAGSKPRGRPPASRNVQDGPFNTFPADPANDRNKQTSSATNDFARLEDDASAWDAAPPQRHADSGGARPGRLSLQVPPHTGRPVRLATPPMVMVTNEATDSEDLASQPPDLPRPEHPVDPMTAILSKANGVTGLSYETLKRTLASDLLRGELLGRHHRLNGEEAKRLAESILQRLNIPNTTTSDDSNPANEVARLTVSSWLALGSHLNIPFGTSIASSHGSRKRLTVTRFRVGSDGYEELVSAGDMDSTASREVFDLSWQASLGACQGTFEIKGLSLADPPPKPVDIHDTIIDTWVDTARRIGMDDGRIKASRERFENAAKDGGFGRKGQESVTGTDGVDWKMRCQALEFGGKMAKGEFLRYREVLIQKVLDTLI